VQSWFPDREFFMRSQGHVRLIKVSSRAQMIAAGLVVGALLAWAVSMGTMAVSQYIAQRDRMVLLQREAQVATAESRVKAYREDIGAAADDLKRRQDFLEQVVEPLDLPSDAAAGETVSDSKEEAAKTVQKVGAAIPEAAGLAKIEARQLALVENLTRYADRRSALASDALRQLGLDPNSVLRYSREAQGGPLEQLSTSADGSIDPRFERLGLSLARMETLEDSLDTIPQFRPTASAVITSTFGYRRDPFTGRGAMHPGIDFRAAYGSPIRAAAKGVVSFVGRKSGYGNVVEVSHGNGLVTRYAHMSATHARVGQEVAAGDVIGAVGSTGRSTGPHLHFEVRVNGSAVNPRPFLERAPYVLEKARGRIVIPARKDAQ
jgi:murein DD-endopeptidase MepM/ murein hydrolase activator NlpD